MSDLFITHLLHAHIDDLRHGGEQRAAVRRALRQRRADAMAMRTGRNGPRPAVAPTPGVAPISAVVSTACAGVGRGAVPAAAPATCCCAVGA